MTKKQLFVPPIPTDNEIHTTTKGIASDLYMVNCYFIMVIGKRDKSMKFSCNSVYLFDWFTSVALIFCQGEDFKCFQMSFHFMQPKMVINQTKIIYFLFQFTFWHGPDNSKHFCKYLLKMWFQCGLSSYCNILINRV